MMLLVKGDPTTAYASSTIVDFGDATGPITTGPHAGGLYTLIVTGDPIYAAPQCGTYTLRVGGALTALVPGC